VDACRYLEYNQRAKDKERKRKAKSDREKTYVNNIIQKASWVKQNLEFKLKMLHADVNAHTKQQNSKQIVEDPMASLV